MADGLDDLNKLDSEVITEQILKTAICLKKGRDDVKIRDIQVLSEHDNVNNYCSRLLFLDVTADVGQGQSRFALFVKISHEEEVRKQRLIDKSPIFRIEAKMYSEIIPIMVKLQMETCGCVIGPNVPDYFFSDVNSDREVIILQDYKSDGYGIISAQQGVDFEHSKLVMKEIAVFHALSWAVKKNNFDFVKNHPFLSKYCFNQYPANTFIEDAVKSCIELIRARMPDPIIKDAVTKLLSVDLNQTMRRLCEPSEPYAVICHGDLHSHNLLLKVEDDLSADLKLTDFQTVHYALPTTDLASFLYSSTSRTTRSVHLKDLLREYHIEFMACLDKLNYSFPEFTFNVLEELYKQSALFGVLMSCLYVPSLLCRTDESKLSQEITEKRDFKNRLELICDIFPDIQKRLFDNFADLVEMGTL